MTLPIQHIPNTHPPRFRWIQTTGTPIGKREVSCEGSLPPSIESAVMSLIARAEQLEAERDKLQKFKNWVHLYLDNLSVPHHPPGTHGAEGCRIGDRMDWLVAELSKTDPNTEPETKPMNQSTGKRKG